MLTVVGAGGGSLPNNLSMNLHEPAFAVVNYGESRFVQVFFLHYNLQTPILHVLFSGD